MEIKHTSYFKDVFRDRQWFQDWVIQVERLNGKIYEKITLDTALGKTIVWGLNPSGSETLVIFPGARTTSLFWDLDNMLESIGGNVRIYLVETNGLPNLSDGHTPDIRSDGYGIWAGEVLEKLGISNTYIAGASFGGLVCMKLCLCAPARIKAVFLLNPGCLQPFSLSVRNLYYNLLPIVNPSEATVSMFLDKAIFCKPSHQVTPQAEKLMVDYELFALTRYKDNTQKPYNMKDELKDVWVDTYLLVGDKDPLFPHVRSVRNARARMPRLRKVMTFSNVAHGIEIYGPAIKAIGEIIREKTEASVSSGGGAETSALTAGPTK